MLYLPDLLEKAIGTAMQGIGSVVDFQLIGLPLQFKLAFRYPVAVPAHYCAVKTVVGIPIGLQVFITQHYIDQLPVFIRDQKADNPCTVVRNSRRSRSVGKGV